MIQTARRCIASRLWHLVYVISNQLNFCRVKRWRIWWNCCVVADVQIRLFTGEAVTQKFGVREPLAAVRLFAHGKIAGGQIDADIGALTFATAFPPRRVFTEEEMPMPLNELGTAALSGSWRIHLILIRLLHFIFGELHCIVMYRGNCERILQCWKVVTVMKFEQCLIRTITL